jgi:hypothetical protein
MKGKQWRDALDSHLNRDGANRRDGKDHDRRRLNFSKSMHGVGFLNGTFDVEGTEIIDTALKRCYAQHHVENDPRTPAQQRADAEVEVHRFYLDHQGRGANRPHLIVTADAETLAGEAVGRCETLSGYRISPDTARRLACDSIMQRIVVNAAGVSLEMGRAERTFTPDQYRAIMIRDGGCRMSGCDAGPEDCQAHHITYWENGGHTDLRVGIAICRGAGHHRLIHEGGWTISGDPNGEITFHDPGGNARGASRPRVPPKPILTRAGRDIARARRRAEALRHHASARAA